jgi:CheY-like chemotaxis protein
LKMKKQLLVVEDNPKNIEDAISALSDFEVVVATTYSEFEKALDLTNPSAVLSDLYFNTGYGMDEKHCRMKDEACSIMEEYVKKIDVRNPVAEVLEFFFKTGSFGSTVDEYLEMMKEMPIIKDESFRSLARIKWKEHETVEHYKSLLYDMKTGMHLLPSGIFVYRHCKEKNIPCVIVTSEYHHGVGFQPFVYCVGQYVDRLENDKKLWAEAAKIVLD